MVVNRINGNLKINFNYWSAFIHENPCAIIIILDSQSSLRKLRLGKQVGNDIRDRCYNCRIICHKWLYLLDKNNILNFQCIIQQFNLDEQEMLFLSIPIYQAGMRDLLHIMMVIIQGKVIDHQIEIWNLLQHFFA